MAETEGGGGNDGLVSLWVRSPVPDFGAGDTWWMTEWPDRAGRGSADTPDGL